MLAIHGTVLAEVLLTTTNVIESGVQAAPNHDQHHVDSGCSMKAGKPFSLFSALVLSTASRTYIACGAFVLLLGASAVVLINRFLPGMAESTVGVGALMFVLALVPALALVWPYLRRPEATISHYSEFVSRLDGTMAEEIAVDMQRTDVRRLGEELNKLSKRFYVRHQEWTQARLELEQIAGLADESPCLIITIDHFGDLRYLNARAEQVISSLGLRQGDLSLLLPKPALQLVEACITNQETLSNIEVTYNGHTFLWTVTPVRGKALLQAHATVISSRQPVRAQVRPEIRPIESTPNDPPHLYAISQHPDYKQKRATILVIDDDPVVHDLMSRYFIREGYEVHCADGGDAGIELAAALKPDLITLDIMMPGKNGWMVLSTLKDDPQLAAIPVVIVSGVGNKNFVHAMGADDYVSKPVDWNELGQKVARLSPSRRTSKVAP